MGTDAQVMNSVFVTVWFAFVVVTSTIILGILIAYLLNQEFRGRAFLRTILILPWAISEIINGLIWQFMYSSQFGVINSALLAMGLIQERIGFLAQGFTALNLVALAYIWNQAPLGAILILAALQAVPRDEIDSGLVDGATAIQRFRHIVFPYLRPTILIVLLLFTFNAFRQFDLIFIMTTGGPGTATSTMSWYSYTITFKYFKFGYGAAVAWFLSAISVVIAIGYMRVMYKKGEEVF
jgi:ABC-type sugar transport system permease subunit